MDKPTFLLQRGNPTRPHLVLRFPLASALIVAMLFCMTANASEPTGKPDDRPTQTPASTSFPQAVPLRAKPLDLRAPDITRLYSAAELERMLNNAKDQDMDEVEVQGARELLPLDVPRVWPGLLAPFWALANPTQAWRIFAPIPSD